MVDDVNDVNVVDVFDGRRDLEDRMFPPEQNNDPYADPGDEQKQDYLPSNTVKMNQTTQEMLVSNLGSNVDRLDQVYEAETDQDIFDAYKEQFQAFLGQYLQFLEAESDDLSGQKDSTSFASRLRLVPASVRDALPGAALSAAVITRKPNWYQSVKNVFVGDVSKAEAEIASIIMGKSGETDDDIRSLGAFNMDVRRKAALTHVLLVDADDLNVASKRYEM
jgi:Tfp pilus tip-associated adhesin PilY1